MNFFVFIYRKKYTFFNLIICFLVCFTWSSSSNSAGQPVYQKPSASTEKIAKRTIDNHNKMIEIHDVVFLGEFVKKIGKPIIDEAFPGGGYQKWDVRVVQDIKGVNIDEKVVFKLPLEMLNAKQLDAKKIVKERKKFEEYWAPLERYYWDLDDPKKSEEQRHMIQKISNMRRRLIFKESMVRYLKKEVVYTFIQGNIFRFYAYRKADGLEIGEYAWRISPLGQGLQDDKLFPDY